MEAKPKRITFLAESCGRASNPSHGVLKTYRTPATRGPLASLAEALGPLATALNPQPNLTSFKSGCLGAPRVPKGTDKDFRNF